MISTASWATFFAVFGVLMFVFLWRLARRLHFQSSLRRRLGGGRQESSLLRSAEDAEGLIKLLGESGLGWTVGTFVRNLALAAFSGLVVGIALGGPGPGLLLAIVAALTIPFYLRRARERRLALCDTQMPQALEIMALALRAGHPLPRALAIAAGEAPAPICDELRRSVDEHELGRELGEVLVGLGRRLEGCEAVHTFVVAVLVLQQTGGNLISVIERIVENARARAHYQAKLRALTAEGRSSARMMAALPGAFILLSALVSPGYMDTMLADRSGNIILAICLGLWILGVLWTRRLTRVES